MLFENFDFGPNVIEKYIDFKINNKLPLKEQKSSLKEDMLQIIYKNNYIIDVGWYPEFDSSGAFIAVVIKDSNWDNPVLLNKCADTESLKIHLNFYIQYISEKILQN